MYQSTQILYINLKEIVLDDTVQIGFSNNSTNLFNFANMTIFYFVLILCVLLFSYSKNAFFLNMHYFLFIFLFRHLFVLFLLFFLFMVFFVLQSSPFLFSPIRYISSPHLFLPLLHRLFLFKYVFLPIFFFKVLLFFLFESIIIFSFFLNRSSSFLSFFESIIIFSIFLSRSSSFLSFYVNRSSPIRN